MVGGFQLSVVIMVKKLSELELVEFLELKN